MRHKCLTKIGMELKLKLLNNFTSPGLQQFPYKDAGAVEYAFNPHLDHAPHDLRVDTEAQKYVGMCRCPLVQLQFGMKPL